MKSTSALKGGADRLIARAPKGLIRFLCVGVFGLATQLGGFDLLHRLGVAKTLAWVCGLVLSTLVTWQLNRRLTFTASGRKRGAEIARYALVTAVSQGVSFIVFNSLIAAEPLARPALPLALHGLAHNLWPDASLIAGAVIATLFSYSGQRFFTFAPQKDVAPEAASVEVPVL
ncbi:MAG: GtrA family protein [Caulobacteraceae bacterium]